MCPLLDALAAVIQLSQKADSSVSLTSNHQESTGKLAQLPLEDVVFFLL
jgi:hypothetical protein